MSLQPVRPDTITLNYESPTGSTGNLGCCRHLGRTMIFRESALAPPFTIPPAPSRPVKHSGGSISLRTPLFSGLYDRFSMLEGMR